MKKKYLLMLLLSLLFITGCDVKYTLNYEDGIFKEEINLNDFYSHSGIEMFPRIEDLKEDGYYADNAGTLKYNQQIKPQGSDLYDVDLDATYEDLSFDESTIFNSCFELNNFEETEDYIYISAYGEFMCDFASNLKINFKSDKAIISHNAPSAKNGTLTWLKEDLTDDGIRLQVSKKTDVSKAKSTSYLSIVVQLIFFTSLLAGVIYFRKKDRDDN